MLKNWRTIAKIVVAVLTALLGTVGATLADSVAPLRYINRGVYPFLLLATCAGVPVERT